MPRQDTQLSLPESFDVKNIIFEPVQARKIPNSEINYHKCSLKMRYPDGSEGPILLQLPRCSTYGVSNHYGNEYDQLSISMLIAESKDDCSDEHKQATQCINDIVQAVKTFTLTEEVKKKIGKYDLEMSELKTISPMTPSRDKDSKKPLLDKPWYLNVKLMTSTSNDGSKSKTCTSKFYSENDFAEVDIKDYIDKRGHVTPIIKIEQIYYGTKPKLLIKMYECQIKGNDTGFKSFFKRPTDSSSSFNSRAELEEYEQEETKPAILEESEESSEAEDDDVQVPIIQAQPVAVSKPQAASSNARRYTKK